MGATVELLQAASRRFGLGIELNHDIAGHESLARHGAAVTSDLLEKVHQADGLMLGPMATYDFKDESRGEISPSKFFRKNLDLYANIRPARTYPSAPCPTEPFDLVVVRENTEGFYADRNVESGGSEILVTEDVVISLRRITRRCCERIARTAFDLAGTRKSHVTLVHKANVLKLGDGMFLEVCREVASDYPSIAVDDVIVTTNMFGDILSDLTAELSGSIGLGGSLNAGRGMPWGKPRTGLRLTLRAVTSRTPFRPSFPLACCLTGMVSAKVCRTSSPRPQRSGPAWRMPSPPARRHPTSAAGWARERPDAPSSSESANPEAVRNVRVPAEPPPLQPTAIL